MKSFVEYRVPLADLDGMRTVYHPNFIKYFDMARTKLFCEAGLPMERWEKTGILLPVVSCSCDYKAPALFDDYLRITAEIDGIRGKVITVKQTIENLAPGNLASGDHASGNVIATGQVILVSCDQDMTPILLEERFPELYRTLLSD